MQRAARRLWSYTQPEGQWFLLYHFGSEICTDLDAFNRIRPPSDRFWADPFVVARENSHYLFFEDWSYRQGYAVISVLQLHKDGSHSEAVPVLDRRYHLSYPFMLEIDDQLHMIPESRQNGSIEVYACDDFPFKWSFHGKLMADVQAVDATFWHQDGRWWMFTAMGDADGGSTVDSLHLFFCTDPLSENWTPHPCNPVVHGIERARPAGNLFVYKGQLYRPSQNCGPSYGYATVINRVDVLTEDVYQEEPVMNLDPRPDLGIYSIHTLNHVDGLTVADGLRYKFRHLW